MPVPVPWLCDRVIVLSSSHSRQNGPKPLIPFTKIILKTLQVIIVILGIHLTQVPPTGCGWGYWLWRAESTICDLPITCWFNCGDLLHEAVEDSATGGRTEHGPITAASPCLLHIEDTGIPPANGEQTDTPGMPAMCRNAARTPATCADNPLP